MAPQDSHSAADAHSHGQDRVTVRPLPKIVFFYPTLLASIIAAVGSSLDPSHAGIYGAIFMIVFGINLLAVGFDITHGVALGGGLIFLVLLFGALYANEYYKVIAGLRAMTRNIHLTANPQFYCFFAGILLFAELVAFVMARLDYWVITPNEIVHRHGVPRNVERMPSPSLRVNKEINDVLEYLLLGAGKLILHGNDIHNAIVLDNVIGVNYKERRIQQLLGAMEVISVDQATSAET